MLQDIVQSINDKYSNVQKMEERTAKLFSRIQSVSYAMKKAMKKTIKKTPKLCGIAVEKNSSSSVYYSYTSTLSSVTNVNTDSISAISNCDSGISSSLPHSPLCPRRYDDELLLPYANESKINYMENELLTSRPQDDVDNIQSIYQHIYSLLPLAESSRHDNNNSDTLFFHQEDVTYALHEQQDDEQLFSSTRNDVEGPLTSTTIQIWHHVIRAYSAMFKQDLSVKKYEQIQIIRATHPHWLLVKNERNEQGYIPTDCLI
ncbi:unnamed protein product [Didymodactylos carnosus]|uniref:SH3 domain-containing protein n=1 Tax=Didymodactylos carnosus TaxID=1234261 RepID=A0A815PEK0_9BILA|nr:unnamed protein product [Didymodactylos carnosus]CAF1447733.1 unnamed protein product [Didymodactylos carnosus]CAF3954612.1 unnamed protein product [Didymodactylos carnosus]CAF4322003.1 unnamed protein product [Didymodactylos carnosus]